MLRRLYRSIGEYDVLRGIFSSEIGTKPVTQEALLAEARSDYSEAAKHYNEVKFMWVVHPFPFSLHEDKKVSFML